MVGLCDLWFSVHSVFITLWFVSLSHLWELFTNAIHWRKKNRNLSAVNELGIIFSLIVFSHHFQDTHFTHYLNYSTTPWNSESPGQISGSWHPNLCKQIYPFSILKSIPNKKNIELQKNGQIQNKYRLPFPIEIPFFFWHFWKSDLGNFARFNKEINF